LSLSSDLLSQARTLVTKESTRPKQASLRRAVSTAYYALFHLLTEDAAKTMFGGRDAVDLRFVVRRAFEHGTMKKAAKGFRAGNLAEPWKHLLDAPSSELKRVANAFFELQEARHQADYDVGHSLTRAEAVALVDQAEIATASWKALRRSSSGSRSVSSEAKVFLAALLLHDKASRSKTKPIEADNTERKWQKMAGRRALHAPEVESEQIT